VSWMGEWEEETMEGGICVFLGGKKKLGGKKQKVEIRGEDCLIAIVDPPVLAPRY